MIKNKAEEFGYKTVSAFMVDSVKSHFKLEVDMKAYRDLTKEINYIGMYQKSCILTTNFNNTSSNVQNKETRIFASLYLSLLPCISQVLKEVELV
ncbi:hypothetical protein CDB3_32040 [Bacillus sp. CDB3]|nr:hypothetical protein CDB3_32040 [Bacillus sp. CDB3]